jgi:hypothetical protein
MLLPWWALMGIMGLVLGGFAAWTTGAARVFMQTLAIPIAIVVTRLAFPLKDSPYYLAYLLLDLTIVAVAAYAGDYIVGLRLGRSDRGGYRNDGVGH